MKLPLFITRLQLSFTKRFLSQSPFVYVAIGDSAAEGIGATSHERSYTGILHTSLKKYKKNVVYHNLGKLGAPIEDVMTRQLEKAIELQPDIVTISVGANDLRVRTNPSTFEKKLRTLLYRLQTETKAHVVMNTVPDFSHAPVIPRFFRHVSRFGIRYVNKIITKVAKERRIVLVDLFDHGSYYSQHFPEAIAKDGFHPSDIGYAIWANALLAEIKQLLKPTKTISSL
jgi:lysophospholipase L1-like esterase